MTRLLLSILILVLSAAPSGAAEWRLGVQGGASTSSFSGDKPAKTKYTGYTGVLLGAVADVRVAADAWLSLQPSFQQRGTTSEVSISGRTDPVPGATVELDYLALPVLLRVYTDNARTYAVGGINVGYLVRAEFLPAEGVDQDVEAGLRRWDLSADFGFGVMFPVGKSRLNVELRYEQGILNLVDGETSDEELPFPSRVRHSGFQFLAGFQWPWGGE